MGCSEGDVIFCFLDTGSGLGRGMVGGRRVGLRATKCVPRTALKSTILVVVILFCIFASLGSFEIQSFLYTIGGLANFGAVSQSHFQFVRHLF